MTLPGIPLEISSDIPLLISLGTLLSFRYSCRDSRDFFKKKSVAFLLRIPSVISSRILPGDSLYFFYKFILWFSFCIFSGFRQRFSMIFSRDPIRDSFIDLSPVFFMDFSWVLSGLPPGFCQGFFRTFFFLNSIRNFFR